MFRDSRFLAAVVSIALPATSALAVEPSARPSVRLMAVGDSITAGADFSSCYRDPLREKLRAAGYAVEFVGTQTSETHDGALAHEGYGGKNTEWLAQNVPEHFRAHPADIVLLHSGHNHTVEERPVPGIVAATEQLITEFRATNPRVTVLLAQVIPAGKLPKYAYLPELNAALAQLAARLDTPAQRVVLVDQASGFDWTTDTVADKVHPNKRGAEKMAAAWFEALKKLLPKPRGNIGFLSAREPTCRSVQARSYKRTAVRLTLKTGRSEPWRADLRIRRERLLRLRLGRSLSHQLQVRASVY